MNRLVVELFSMSSLEYEEAVALAKYLANNGVVVQKHGRWILKEVCGPNTQKFHCSVCDKIPKSLSTETYCPNCGAKMDLMEGEI